MMITGRNNEDKIQLVLSYVKWQAAVILTLANTFCTIPYQQFLHLFRVHFFVNKRPGAFYNLLSRILLLQKFAVLSISFFLPFPFSSNLSSGTWWCLIANCLLDARQNTFNKRRPRHSANFFPKGHHLIHYYASQWKYLFTFCIFMYLCR